MPLALVVEDNSDVMEYLTSCLKGQYQMAFAENGTQGVEKALELVPDIVISDVMMPGKDGFALCAELKEDLRTSHIPIILLTAKADMDSRIKGLRKGADAYIVKPFNREELFARLDQLISIRKRLQERYQQRVLSINIQQSEARYQREDAFILQIQKVILEELDDETFDTERLCRSMGMSVSQLYRKLKALTGSSMAIYIRSIRLVKALELLRQTDKSVSEIAYEVGFKDAAYFSRCFREEFGKSPKGARV